MKWHRVRRFLGPCFPEGGDAKKNIFCTGEGVFSILATDTIEGKVCDSFGPNYTTKLKFVTFWISYYFIQLCYRN